MKFQIKCSYLLGTGYWHDCYVPFCSEKAAQKEFSIPRSLFWNNHFWYISLEQMTKESLERKEGPIYRIEKL